MCAYQCENGTAEASPLPKGRTFGFGPSRILLGRIVWLVYFSGKEPFKGIKVNGFELTKPLHPSAGTAQGIRF